MRKKLIRNGHSKALIMDRTLLAHIGIEDEVEILLLKGRIVLMRPALRNELAEDLIEKISTRSERSTTKCQTDDSRKDRLNDGRAGRKEKLK